DLFESSLVGKLIPQGEGVKLRRAGQTQLNPVSTETSIYAGDFITVEAGSTAEIKYPDGSSLLLKEDTTITIKESRGRSYIKTGGLPGTAVEFLNVDLTQGMMFAALATKEDNDTANRPTTSLNYKAEQPLFAALDPWTLWAAAKTGNQNLPWWEANKNKRVKVKVDMPWGVAAVRGTFLYASVNPQGGGQISCLDGVTEVSSVSPDGVPSSPVQVIGGQETQVSGTGAPPAPPTPMGPQSIQQFAQVQGWVVNTALDMDNQQEAPPTPPAPPAPQAQSAPQTQPPGALNKTINAMQNMGIQLSESLRSSLEETTGQALPAPPPANNNGSSGSSGGGGHSPTSPADQYGGIAGQVIHAVDASGISGLTVNLRPGTDTYSGDIIATCQTGQDGTYSFANLSPGNYTIEVSGEGYITSYLNVSCEAGRITGNQNVTVTPLLAEGLTRIILTWGESPSDLDSYLIGPTCDGKGFEVCYWERVYEEAGIKFAELDIDDTDSYGPETTTIYQQQPDGEYKFAVHQWSDGGTLAESNAAVQVYRGDSLVASFNVPTNQEGRWWTVFTLHGDVLTSINTISDNFYPGSTGEIFHDMSFAGDSLNIYLWDADLADSETVSVKLVSSSDPAGITVNLAKVDYTAGCFAGTVHLVSSDSDESQVMLKANAGDTITITYIDQCNRLGYVETLKYYIEVDDLPPLAYDLSLTSADGTINAEIMYDWYGGKIEIYLPPDYTANFTSGTAFVSKKAYASLYTPNGSFNLTNIVIEPDVNIAELLINLLQLIDGGNDGVSPATLLANSGSYLTLADYYNENATMSYFIEVHIEEP
ncbi:MAG: carboxypeptidase regulatory-like domain-containing protein, partial [Syntrophomonadaceae bacterium]